MDQLRFEWDDSKFQMNVQKHGVDFWEAQTVFYDENAILFDDPDHSIEEERFLLLGMTMFDHLCIVSHCYRDEENTIRIISARLATKREKQTYFDYLGGVMHER